MDKKEFNNLLILLNLWKECADCGIDPVKCAMKECRKMQVYEFYEKMKDLPNQDIWDLLQEHNACKEKNKD